MLRVMVDRDRDERGHIETAVCRMDAGPCPRRLVEALEEGDGPRPGVREPAEQVGRARCLRDPARDRAPSTTNGARSRRGSRSSARTTRRARRRSSGERPRWPPFARRLRPARRRREPAPRAALGNRQNDRTSAARLVTRPMSVLDPREASGTLLLLVESMGVTRRLLRHAASRMRRTTPSRGASGRRDPGSRP